MRWCTVAAGTPPGRNTPLYNGKLYKSTAIYRVLRLRRYSAMVPDHSLETLTAEHFRNVRTAPFRVTGKADPDGRSVSFDAELIDVVEHSAGGAGTARNPFSVVFGGPAEPVLPQGICRLEHEQLGPLDVFLVPVGPGEPAAPGPAAAAMRYEAVFS